MASCRLGRASGEALTPGSAPFIEGWQGAQILRRISSAYEVSHSTVGRGSAWREAFLAAGEASLSTRPMDDEALQGERLKAHAFSEMLLERKLLEAKIALPEAPRPGASHPSPLARARRRR